MINDPLFATRVLDARNNEGLRYIGLGILKNEEKKKSYIFLCIVYKVKSGFEYCI